MNQSISSDLGDLGVSAVVFSLSEAAQDALFQLTKLAIPRAFRYPHRMHTQSGTPHRVARSALARVATAPTPFDHTLPLPALSAAKAAEVLARLEAPPQPAAPRPRALPFVGPRRRAPGRATLPGVGIQRADVPPPRDQIPTSRERPLAFDRHALSTSAMEGTASEMGPTASLTAEPGSTLGWMSDREARDAPGPLDESEPVASVLSIEPRELLPRAETPRRHRTHFALVAVALAVALGALGLVAWRAEDAARARAAAPTGIEASDPAAMTPTQP